MAKKKAPNGNKNNEKMKDTKNYPKMDNELTYFLDHPDIHREECIGNGNAPGSLASQINFGGKGTAAPKPAASTPAPAAASKPSIASQIGWPGAKK
jgi:hypothetical protein